MSSATAAHRQVPLPSVPTAAAEATRLVQQAAIRRVLSEGGPKIVYQPQLSLSRLVVDGYEALARFPQTPLRGTEQWFTRARDLGLGTALEASALKRALSRRQERPTGTLLAVNLSPGVLVSPAVAAILPADLSGIEIELTEHEWARGGNRLRRQIDRLRERGARVAIDDVGAAHSGLCRVVDLAPDRIKLDKHLVQGVAGSPTKSALIRAVVDFAEQIDAAVVAEGVENLDDLEALAQLDVGYAQGWLIGQPEAGFPDADPVVIASGRDSLARMLHGRERSPIPTPGATADLAELLDALTRVSGLTALGALAGTCAGALGADRLVISVLSADGSRLAPVPGSNLLDRSPASSLAEHPLTQRCLQTRAVIAICPGSEEGGDGGRGLTRLGFEAALLVPVISRDRVIGLLECYRRAATPWSRRQIRSARTVAAMLGPVLDVALTH